MRPSRFSISVISIKHRLPMLIGALLLGIILASTFASYVGVKESSLDVGRERLQNLTKQLGMIFQQSNTLLLTKTGTAANEPAIKAFLQSPSPATRSAASVSLRQIEIPQDKNSLQIELWNTNRALVLTVPDGASPTSLDLDTEFKAVAVDPFKTSGSMRVIKDVITAPAVVAVQDDSGKPIGYLVRWRRITINPTPKALTDLLGSEAALYFGNVHGDLLTNLEQITSKPRADMGSTSEVMQYLRDGNRVLALSRPIGGTPWFLAIEFPEQPLLAPAHRFLKRVLLADLVVFISGMAGAVVLSRGITNPLQVLTEAASAIGSGDYSRTVDIHRHDELGALASAFNRMVVTTRDSQLELQRRIQERTLQLEAAPCAMLMFNREGLLTLVNAQTELLFGYDRTELLEQPVEMLLPARYRAAHSDHSQVFTHNPSTLAVGAGRDLYGLRKNGSEVPIEIGLNPIHADDGAFVLASIIDISERKREELILRESEERLGTIIENLHEGLLISDLDGQLTHFNHAGLMMHGFSSVEEGLLRVPQFHEMFELSRLDGSVLKFEEWPLARVMSGDVLTEYEVRLRRIDRDWHAIFSYGGAIVKAPNGQLLAFLTIIDITERKRNEAELKLNAEKLERSNAELQDFAQIASHDLQEPLRKILAFGDRLKARAGESLDNESRDYLQRMFSATARMQTLITDLMTFSRVDTKGQAFMSTDLGEIAREVSADLETRIEQTVGRVEIEELPTIDADPMQMRQLLQNLIGNSLKYHRPGVPPVVRIYSQKIDERRLASITKRGGVAQQLCQILVEDNGIGFDEKYLDRIFTMFQRLHKRGEYEGTGVGLAICRKIVVRHNGTITARSRPGQGTTFMVTMPVRQLREVEVL